MVSGKTAVKPSKAAAPAATMMAVRISEFGGPEVLRYEEVPRPRAGDGEALVRVHASGVNPVDWKARQGFLKGLRSELPWIPGWDFSGVVEESGLGVRWKPGDEVYSRPDLSRDGSYAEYIVVRGAELASKPASLDHLRAAAVPLAGLTAWQALFDVARLEAGQTVLVHAAAGGVGCFAVQLAKWKGAKVVGTCSARNLEFVRGLGADEVLDYTTSPFEEIVRDADVVLDPVGGQTQDRSWVALKKGGILVSLVQPPPFETASALGVRGTGMMTRTLPDQLSELGRLIDEGRLRVPLENVFPLPEARRAQEFVETGHARGKTVLKVA
jgi:NADPH:quinone reductase-like Zn-dependent oxidoreductase